MREMDDELAAPYSRDGSDSVLALVLASGLRLARDAFGPVLVFYLGWKLIGFGVGIASATGFAVGAYAWERGQTRSGLTAAIGLAGALAQGLVGTASGHTTGYFAPPLIINGVFGLAFLVSVVIGQPLASVFAAEIYPFPPAVTGSRTFRRICSRISLVWAAYLLLGSAVRVAVLLRSSVDLYVVVNFLTGLPFTAMLMSWTVWHARRGFRRIEDTSA